MDQTLPIYETTPLMELAGMALNNRWIIIPKYIGCILFSALLFGKIGYAGGNAMSWLYVFFPLFIIDVLSNYSNLFEIYKQYLSLNRNSVEAGKSLTNLIDGIGQTLCHIGCCVYLSCNASNDRNILKSTQEVPMTGFLSLRYSLLGLWIATSVSLLLQIYLGIVVTTNYRSNSCRFQMRTIKVFKTCIFVTLRLVQPLLIALALDRVFVWDNWAIVFSPLWIISFAGIALALLIILCAPYIHANTAVSLRESASSLIFYCAVQMIIYSTCVLIVLIYVVQRLNYEYGYSNGQYTPVLQILLPVVTLYLLLLFYHRILLKAVDSYSVCETNTNNFDYTHLLSLNINLHIIILKK